MKRFHFDQKIWESKKAIALYITLAIVLVISVLGICFHQQVADLVKWIVGLCSSYHISQATCDSVTRYKEGAKSAFEKVTYWVADFDDQDRYANR